MLGGQFDCAVASERVTEAPKGSLRLDGNQPQSVMAEGSLTARLTGRAGNGIVTGKFCLFFVCSFLQRGVIWNGDN